MTSKDAASVAPLVLLGETRKRLLDEVLSQCLNAWRKERCAVSGTDSVSVTAQFGVSPPLNSQAPTLGSAARWIAACAVGGTAMVYVLADSNAPSDLLGLPRKGSAHDETNSPIAGSLIAELLESMAVAIALRAQYQLPQVTASAVALSEFQGGRSLGRWWRASYGESLTLLLHPQLVALLAPPKKSTPGAPVEKRRAAIGNETVKLQAVLGNAEVSVGELSSLRINDVIVLSNAINQPGQLRMRNEMHVANVSVGRLDGKRAVVVMKP